eukprot:TRINITY_DN15732_c0_g1_i1.p1 TRINITY_DN15732_c0_g1~~TRINITY_DN15732_c0_g1_i1.p1  ORF type:complete len:176 (-),score=47.49 TRINITY_DN15732_c0_g1_i1:65-592(-)
MEIPGAFKPEETPKDENPFEGPSSLPAKGHYDAVKMKYFASLGMNKHPTPPPNRERGQTTPPLRYNEITNALSEDDRNYLKPISPARKRSISTPINTTKGIPIPGSRASESGIFSFDSDEEMPNEAGSPDMPEESWRGGKFIPPHELMAKGDFEVGTARSLAIWEAQRRKRGNDF